ncbi:MAG: phosphoribosyl-ATP diphosphatase [Chloroflexi bacterium]|nr:phosphoribosyl-ATP diphosphatase [Chloroflexota bacterium]
MAWLSERRPDWSRADLLPVVVTDAGRGDLLMLAWANREALEATADPETSYTARLLDGGPRRPAEKVTEEAGELSAAALAGTDEEVIGEAADLFYHALVLLEARGQSLSVVEAELARRHGPSGS